MTFILKSQRQQHGVIEPDVADFGAGKDDDELPDCGVGVGVVGCTMASGWTKFIMLYLCCKQYQLCCAELRR